MVNDRKVAIVGCGFVGSSSAFALMQSGLFSEMVLIDVDRDRAEGEALDISHGSPFASPMKIYAGDYKDAADAAIIVVILLIVSNPVDVLTYAAIKMSGLPESRVIGSGTVLDSARLKDALGAHLGVDPRNVHAYIIGEHGDSELAVWSSANVSGVPLHDFCEMRGHFDHEASEKRIADEVKNAAYEIINKKHATYYGIAMSVKRLCTAIMRDEKHILPVSSLMVGEYGLEDIAISMPTIVGRNGVECRVPVSLDEEELAELHRSASALKDVIDQVDFNA